MTENYLRSRQRRGRWFHYYRRNDYEASLGVHGLEPTDPKVKAAYWAEHARWQDMPPETTTPTANTFAWGLDIYLSGNHKWADYAEGTQKSRMAIFKRYRKVAGSRSLSSITTDDIEAALYAKGGHGAANELKALKPVFHHLKKLRIIPKDPAANVELDTPPIKGFPTTSADEIEAFIERWEVGTRERLIFDLGLFTGAARSDLACLGRHHIEGNLLTFNRHKSGVETHVPITGELRKVINRTPDISPTFILNSYGKPYTKESLGNLYGDAAQEAGIVSRLHGLRKAFCVYWAENGKTTHEIAAMSGHLSLTEVQRYTKAADRKRIIQLIAGAG
jgi:site-specific recombinase XerD